MPAVRLSRRRRSSLAISFTPAKAGIYGIARQVTFAPNVTPVTFVESDDPITAASGSTSEPGSPTSALFPPSDNPQPTSNRRRAPPGKRRSMGYIPRPPNAFMLFRADFVRQKHVPGTIETNHGSLSKIIGNCWRALPLEEKRVWEVKAKHAKAEHRVRYPEYRFKPVHNKNKGKKKEKTIVTEEDERRCEEVAQLLLEGKKGDELAAAVRHLDLTRSKSPALLHVPIPVSAQQQYHNPISSSSVSPAPIFHHRRSSSVPLPNDYYPAFNYGFATNNIAIPAAPPFFSNSASSSRPDSPMISSLARQQQQQRMMLGHRRASSVGPTTFVGGNHAMNRSWAMPSSSTFLERDPSPLPDVDTSLFNPNYLETGFSFNAFNDQSLSNVISTTTSSTCSASPHQNALGLGPLDIGPHDVFASQAELSATSSVDIDPLAWMTPTPTTTAATNESHPSTAYSGSPHSTTGEVLPPLLHAPQPHIPSTVAELWKEFDGSFTNTTTTTSVPFMDDQQFLVDPTGLGLGLGFGVDFNGMQDREVEVVDFSCLQHQHQGEAFGDQSQQQFFENAGDAFLGQVF